MSLRYPIPDAALAEGLRRRTFGADPERRTLYRQLAELVPWLGGADHDLARRLVFQPGIDDVPLIGGIRDAIARGCAARSDGRVAAE